MVQLRQLEDRNTAVVTKTAAGSRLSYKAPGRRFKSKFSIRMVKLLQLSHSTGNPKSHVGM